VPFEIVNKRSQMGTDAGHLFRLRCAGFGAWFLARVIAVARLD
jgi:hypothetical protein